MFYTNSVYASLHDYISNNYEVDSDNSKGTLWTMSVKYIPYGLDPNEEWNISSFEVLRLGNYQNVYSLTFVNFYIPY